MASPLVTAADVERLVAALSGGAWSTAAELSVAIYGSDTETHKRRIRAVASAAGDGVVSFPGSPGYKLWRHCTAEELHRCVQAYSSQTDEMRLRRDLYRRRLHRESPATFTESPELKPSREQLALF